MHVQIALFQVLDLKKGTKIFITKKELETSTPKFDAFCISKKTHFLQENPNLVQSTLQTPLL